MKLLIGFIFGIIFGVIGFSTIIIRPNDTVYVIIGLFLSMVLMIVFERKYVQYKRNQWNEKIRRK